MRFNRSSSASMMGLRSRKTARTSIAGGTIASQCPRRSRWRMRLVRRGNGQGVLFMERGAREDLSEILDKAITQLGSGDSVEDLLDAHPQQAPALDSLLHVAAALQ